MDYFSYRHGTLHAENLSITDLASAVGTPFYCYSAATLSRHYSVFTALFEGINHRICYAVKANDALAILALLAKLGAGADVVSQGEIFKALKAGIAADKMVFSGVGKQPDEIYHALKLGIFQFNIESSAELHTIAEIAANMGAKAPIALRINPDIDPKTHAKISTGQKESKFGIPMAEALSLYQQAMTMPSIAVQGISMHIGSQLLDLSPFEAAFERVAAFVTTLRSQHIPIRHIDVGGGFGIRYRNEDNSPDLADYGRIIRNKVGHLITPDGSLILEPGRMLVGNAGILVSSVIYVKQGESKNFLILDAGMNDLIRPTLYSAHHEIIPVLQSTETTKPMDIVGPVCETGDLFAENRPMPPLKAGDLVAFRSAGAYGAVMANRYNSRPRLAEIMVNDARFDIICKRETYDDLIAHQVIPDYL